MEKCACYGELAATQGCATLVVSPCYDFEQVLAFIADKPFAKLLEDEKQAGEKVLIKV